MSMKKFNLTWHTFYAFSVCSLMISLRYGIWRAVWTLETRCPFKWCWPRLKLNIHRPEQTRHKAAGSRLTPNFIKKLCIHQIKIEQEKKIIIRKSQFIAQSKYQITGTWRADQIGLPIKAVFCYFDFSHTHDFKSQNQTKQDLSDSHLSWHTKHTRVHPIIPNYMYIAILPDAPDQSPLKWPEPSPARTYRPAWRGCSPKRKGNATEISRTLMTTLTLT